ncbi:MAG: hypothetical protein QME81_02725 [bacterium]|nr:hypothetical protein [bacterium]
MLRRLSCVFIILYSVSCPSLAMAIILGPPIVEMNIPAGATRETTLTVVNDSAEELNFRLYTTDLTKNREGKLEFPDLGSTKYSCAKGIRLETQYLHLLPNEKKEIKAEISIPGSASGSAYAAVMCEAIIEQRPTKGINITPRWRMGSLIVITIPGRIREQVQINNISYQPPTEKEGRRFLCTVANMGNILVKKGLGYLSIMDEHKRIIERIKLSVEQAIFPETEYDIILSPKRHCQPGTYTASASIHFQEISAVSKEFKFRIEEEKDSIKREASSETSANASTIALEVTPAQIKVEIPPGGYRSVPLRLKNEEMETLKIKAELGDISYDREGKIRYLKAGQTPYSLNNILKIRPEEVILNPGGEKGINLMFKVDKEKAGGLYGSLILTIESVETEYILSEQQKVKIEALVSKTIKEAGELGEVEITPGKKKIDLKVAFLNEGNVALNPRGEAKIMYRNLQEVGKVLFKEHPVMPGDVVEMRASYHSPEKSLSSGKYTVSIKIDYNEKESLYTKEEFRIK